VDSASEFEAYLGVVAEVCSLDRFLFDGTVLDDIDEIVYLLVMIGLDLGFEKFCNGADSRLENMKQFVKGETELVSVVSCQLIVHWDSVDRCWVCRH
jgi:hypothetical protein